MRLFARISLAVLLLGCPLATAAAQVGSTTDIITGVVTGTDGQPVAVANVEAMSLDTRITRTTRTDQRGRYTILFPDGGGQYRLTVRAIGMSPVQRTVARQTDEDRLVVDISMAATARQLDEIVVRGRNAPTQRESPPTPGSTERVLSPDQLARLPIDASDLNLLATLAPGVVSLPGSDSTAAGFSVAGQRPTANAITLDGISFGASTVPQDAVRSTRVITNSYDASRGQFSGGQIATTTRAGTNVVQGTTNYGFRDRSLAISSDQSNPFAAGFTQHQLSFGLGGPIVHNKLFIFGSAQGRFRGDELQSLLNAPRASLDRLGTSADSVNRFLDIAAARGIAVDRDLTDAERNTDDISTIVRLDYLAGEQHTITVRGDYRHNQQEPTRIGALSLPAASTHSNSSGGGGMVTLSSRFGQRVVNELKAYLSGSEQNAPAALLQPSGRVQVGSALPDGSQGIATYTFGGNPGLPQHSSNRLLEITNEVSWIPGAGAHRVKLGLLLNSNRIESDASFDRFGTFSFNSLADLESGAPAIYTRTLTPTLRASTTQNGAIYLADNWRMSRAWQFTYGARFEGSDLRGAPAANPAVEQLFGRRTDQWPSEFHVSPRVGFSWVVGGLNPESPPRLFVRGGIGEFRSPVPTGLVAAAQAAPGFDTSESQLVCVGAAAPTPDWAAYRADAATIPTSCIGGLPGNPLPDRSPTVTVFAPGFEAPRAWRGSLGAQWRKGFISVGLDASYARGVSQSGFTDLNLGPAQFALTGEGGRPVYAAPSTIDPRTGTVGLFASRRFPTFGQVLSINSNLASENYQFTLSGNGITKAGAIFSLSYTWARSRDQSSFSSGGAQRGFASQTAGFDPNTPEWATSDFERRHSFLATLTYPLSNAIELTTIARMTSGSPYTPAVNTDINGDGARNDRAFIPLRAAAADTALGNGLGRLLDHASGSVRACLESQQGGLAGRNSCRGPWQPSLDFQMNWRPSVFGLNRRLAVSVVTSNLLGGIDELFHGADNLQGWGQSSRPDGTLLYVRGFDPVSQQYLYLVNERFGASAANTTAIRIPFQVGLQLRYTIGPDRQRELIQGIRGARGAGGAGGSANFLSRFETLIPNPAREVLAIKVSLNLTDDQVAKLTALSDSTGAHNKAIADTVRRQIEQAGANPDPGRLFATIRPHIEAARAAGQAALKTVESILTPEQWGQVPERIKRPAGFGGGGAGGGGRRPPPA